jgi:hypothetical protein
MPAEAEKKIEEAEELEIEVEEEQDESAVAAETEESDAPAKQAGNDDNELEQYSEGVQKRISKLTAKMREAERREQAALEYAQSVQKQLNDAAQRTSSLDSSFVNEFESRITYQEQALRNQMREAIDRGDIDAQVEAQKNLAKLAHETERLAYVKQQRERAASQPAPEQEQPRQQAQPQAAPDPKASAWAERNEWFGQDEPMTLTAFSIHKQLIEGEGFDPTADDYYDELDRRLRREFPHKFGEQAAPARNGRSGPAVAGANRGKSTNGQKSVKLTQSQVAIARKLGITNEQYAKQLLRMQNS